MMKTTAAILAFANSANALSCRSVSFGGDNGDQPCASCVTQCVQFAWKPFGDTTDYVQGCDDSGDCEPYANSGGDGCNDQSNVGFVDAIKCSASNDFGVSTEAGLIASLGDITEACIAPGATPFPTYMAPGETPSPTRMASDPLTPPLTPYPTTDLAFPECGVECAFDPEGGPFLVDGDICGFLGWKDVEPRQCLVTCTAADDLTFDTFYEVLSCGIGGAPLPTPPPTPAPTLVDPEAPQEETSSPTSSPTSPPTASPTSSLVPQVETEGTKNGGGLNSASTIAIATVFGVMGAAGMIALGVTAVKRNRAAAKEEAATGYSRQDYAGGDRAQHFDNLQSERVMGRFVARGKPFI
jgi:hypothetical protein